MLLRQIFHSHSTAALPLADWFGDNWGWIVGGLIVGVGLLGFGYRELTRFSFRRVWAISGVCFAESIRKRVLWITPVAIIGVLVITQLERAFDEADAIRQTVKFCLFTTGVVVIITSIILACTNLPKEIETRVIYTIVTKPVTRLEIILGKVIGFARVSLAILLIMGIFTAVYLRLRAHGKENEITYRLREGNLSDTERTRLNHYKDGGLLSSRTLWVADSLQVYGRQPEIGARQHVFNGTGDQDLLSEYRMDQFDNEKRQLAARSGLIIRARVSYERTGEAVDQPDEMRAEALGPSIGPTTRHLVPPFVTLEMLDEGQYTFLSEPMITAGTIPELIQSMRAYIRDNKASSNNMLLATRLSESMRASDGAEGNFAYAWLSPQAAVTLFAHPRVFVRLAGASYHTDFFADDHPIEMFVPQIEKAPFVLEGAGIPKIPGPAHIFFRGRTGLRLEQQLKGGADEGTSVTVFSFRNTPPAQAIDGKVPFEITTAIQREDAVVHEGNEDATTLDLQLVNQDTKKTTAVEISVENNRPVFFTVPADAISGGNYDIVIRCKNTGHTIGFFADSLRLVQSTESFEWNLVKSLGILWMMSILVIALAVACSTFLSWPIAIVMTIVLLLGRWGVTHLADTSPKELGRQIVSDFKIGENDAPVATAVSSSVEMLSTTLNYFARVLPDPESFDAIDDTEAGISLPPEKIWSAFAMMGGFGLPAVVLGFLILRNKEVAP